MQPRPYQLSAFDDTKNAFKQGHKHICVCMSGGAGKSLLCKMIIDSAVQKNSNSKIGFFSFRKSLTEQIKKYNIPNVDVGTLQKFGKTETSEYDLVIFDEKDYHGTKLKNNIKSKYSITLSGFPTDADGYTLDYDNIVEAIQFPDLVEQGYAKPVKVLATSKIDTTKLKKQAGDFHKGQSFDLMEKAEVKRDLVDTYNKYCIGRKTLLFAIDTKHAESLKEEFLANGIKCETIHSKKQDDGIIKRYEDGEFNLLINVAMISIGVDIPCINTIMFARPMCSVPLMMQCIWRGTRKFNDDYCLVLDCAEVLKRCNFHPMQKLDLTRKKQTRKAKQCKCGCDMTIIDKKTRPYDEVTYIQKTTYRCTTCGNFEEVEELKVINLSFCDSCKEPILARNVQYRQTDKAIEFYFKCDCGHEKVEREVLLTDKELKEIAYEKTMSGEATWDKVELIMRDIAKSLKYNWKWSQHKVEAFKNTGRTPQEIIDKVDEIKARGYKLSAVAYI